jgi:hypothetical protein
MAIRSSGHHSSPSLTGTPVPTWWTPPAPKGVTPPG